MNQIAHVMGSPYNTMSCIWAHAAGFERFELSNTRQVHIYRFLVLDSDLFYNIS